MGNIIKQILKNISKTPKNIAVQVDQYVDKKINKAYDNIKIEKRQQVKFFTSIIVIVCLVIIFLVPIAYTFTKIKAKFLEHSIKSPNQIMHDLDGCISENYPKIEIDVLKGAYIDDETESIGYLWQYNGGINCIKYSNDDLILEKENIAIAPINLLNVQYDGSEKEQIQIYSPNMEVFCIIDNPALYQKNDYITANPYIMLHTNNSPSTWEIFSFYKGQHDEMLKLLTKNKTNLYTYLVNNSDYTPKQMAPTSEFAGNLLVILATDRANHRSYVIGAKMQLLYKL